MVEKVQFTKIPHLEERSFNSILERFYDLKLDGVVRENIQNSLDGKLNTCTEPVVVKINTGTMAPNEIPGLDEIKAHAHCLEGGSSYARETIAHIKSHLDDTPVTYITFEDENTKGLTGAEYGDDLSKKGTWGAYAYQKGYHLEDTDAEVEKTRGGSHGVGKIACNAASDLHVMFFANCDEHGNQHLGGTVQFVEHELAGQCYRATGYFSDMKGDHMVPFANTFCGPFQKNTRGLKIIIPYLRAQYNNETALIKAVCDNFFVAILKNQLVVYVNGKEISLDTIKDIVKDKEIYSDDEMEGRNPNLTPLFVNTYLEQTPISMSINDSTTTYNFLLFFTMDDNIKRGITAVVRSIGMKIENKKIPGFVRAPYNAVLMPMDPQGDIFLKSLENESHTSMSSDHIKDPKGAKNAIKFIRNLERKMQDLINSKIKEAHPTDGKIDTSELIFSQEAQFKKDLEKNTIAVTVNMGNGKKEIVKVGSKETRKKREKKEKPDKHNKQERKKRTGKTISIKNPGEQPKIEYSMSPEAVKRVVLDNKERLQIDLTNLDGYTNQSKCDISLFPVFGDGSTSGSRLRIGENYGQILDLTNGQTYGILSDTIRDVAINNGKINIELEIKARFNTAMKFMYNVVVQK